MVVGDLWVYLSRRLGEGEKIKDQLLVVQIVIYCVVYLVRVFDS